MAIRISIRDDLSAFPLRHHARKLAEETDASRMRGVCFLVCRERVCDVAISLDGIYEVETSCQWSVVSYRKKSEDDTN